MPRFYLLGLVVTFLSVGGVGVAAATADEKYAYGWVRPNPSAKPTFETQDNMASVRRVGLGRYCLRAAIKFVRKPVGQLTTDLSLSAGKPGIAMLENKSRLCQQEEVAVVTYLFTDTGRLKLSNEISFIVDPVA